MNQLPPCSEGVRASRKLNFQAAVVHPRRECRNPTLGPSSDTIAPI
jgi:hypothetical protein